MNVIYLLIFEFIFRTLVSKNLFFILPFILIYFVNKNKYFIAIFLSFSFLNDILLVLPIGFTGLVLGLSILILYIISSFINMDKLLGLILSMSLMLLILIFIIFYFKLQYLSFEFIFYLFLINILYSLFILIVYKLL